MKKMMGVMLVVVLVLGLAVAAFAGLAEKKAEFAKVGKYISTLDKKIIKARAARQINKVAQLKAIKRKELARAKKLKSEIAALKSSGIEEESVIEVMPVTPVTSVAKAEQKIDVIGRESGFQIGGGYGGGAGIVDISYIMPVKDNLDFVLGGVYGIGNQYTITVIKVAGIMPLGNNYAGLGIGMANYSQSVADIPLVSGNISAGSNTGVSIFAGTTLDVLQVQVGYDSALGLILSAGYKL